MKKLSEIEEKMLNRYQRCSVTVDSFILLKSNALAANKLINVVEETFKMQEPAPKDYLFLKKLTERKAKNFSTLAGVDATIKLFTILKQKSFSEIKIDETI